MRGRLRRGDWVVVVVLGVVLVANLWARAALPARTDALNKLTEAVERNTMATQTQTIERIRASEQMLERELARTDLADFERDAISARQNALKHRRENLEKELGDGG